MARQAATDAEYGFTEKKPIAVGGKHGPARGAVVFFGSITGPEGQEIRFKRLGSCCVFETPNGIDNTGLLDRYEVTYDGLKKLVIIYINGYDFDPPMAPVGFKPRRIE